MRPHRLLPPLLVFATLVACQPPAAPRRPGGAYVPGTFGNRETPPPGTASIGSGPDRSASATVSGPGPGYAGPVTPAPGASLPAPGPSAGVAATSPAASVPGPMATAGYASIVGTIAAGGQPVARAALELVEPDSKAHVASSVSGADGTFAFTVAYSHLPASFLIQVESNGPAFAGLIRLDPAAAGADPVAHYDGSNSNTGAYSVSLASP